MKHTRRGFLSFLAALPFVGAVLAKATPEEKFAHLRDNPGEPVFREEVDVEFGYVGEPDTYGVIVYTDVIGATLADIGHSVWHSPDGLTLKANHSAEPAGYVVQVKRAFTSVMLTGTYLPMAD